MYSNNIYGINASNLTEIIWTNTSIPIFKVITLNMVSNLCYRFIVKFKELI